MLLHSFAAASLLAMGASDAQSYIPVMREQLLVESAYIKAIGLNPRDFTFRLDYLLGRITAIDARASDGERTDLQSQTKLELKLDAELLVNLCPVFAAIDGLDESFYNSDPKLPPDPVAFYVPKPDAHGRYALVVLLHGRAQTETDVVSRALFLRLADASHAIVVAPWGTGPTLWGDPAALETAHIVDEVERAFPVDRQRVFLVGLAGGGEGAFHVATRYPEQFRALLDIGGGLRPGDAYLTGIALHTRNLYLVNSTPDLYKILAAACMAASYYPTDGSDFYKTSGDVERAWNDMFDGVVRNDNTRDCS